jgi:predicted RNase H-like HicB family nuclease
MPHFLAIVEDARPDHAVGVWFPDVPGCFSAGDTLDEAIIINAPEALASHLSILRAKRQPLPVPRSIDELRRDPEVAPEIEKFIVAVVPWDDAPAQAAAE